MTFCKVKNNQIDEAYQILTNRIDELISKNTGQYISYYPSKDIYITRNENNENWCLFDNNNNKTLGIVSITKNHLPDEWDIYGNKQKIYWLSSLFVAPAYKGKKYGEKIIEECRKLGKRESIKGIYLDCYMNSCFLVSYYERNGFLKIAEKEFIYGSRRFNAALMKKEI